jgi:hypothetical protein
MRPYLIVGHDYRRTSAGIRALHKLCHLINTLGDGVAYVLADVVNEEWNTPQADAEVIEWIADEGIVVYPEVEDGNPLEAKRIVRYFLNRPGLIRKAKYTQGEYAFCYCGLLRRFVPSDDRILTIPVVDTGLFYDRGFERYGEVVWWGKWDGPDVLDYQRQGMRKITLDWPEDHETLAALFQCTRIFYSYTDYTMLTIEARLSGCPTVVIPSSFYSADVFAEGSPGGIAGLAWGPSLGQIKRAFSTVRSFKHQYMEYIEQFGEQFNRFLEITQEIESC